MANVLVKLLASSLYEVLAVNCSTINHSDVARACFHICTTNIITWLKIFRFINFRKLISVAQAINYCIQNYYR